MAKKITLRNRIHYSAIPNNFIDDPNISPQAGWLFTIIQRWTCDINIPEDFNVTEIFIKEKTRMSDTEFNNAWKELIENGYLKYAFDDNSGEEAFILLNEKDGEQ